MPDVTRNYRMAKQQYAKLGVNVDQAIKQLSRIPISLHCWQGDDVTGFESRSSAGVGGGLQATGNFPGRARDIGELRMDLAQAFSLIPGPHRLNLHAIYGEFGTEGVARNKIGPEHFQGWVKWAKSQNLKLDFNATCFGHPMADSGFTLSSPDKGVRKFWIEHVKRCRAIGAFMGKSLHSPCIHNLWIPDGSKEVPADRWGFRARLKDSLDQIYSVKYNSAHLKDSLEGKLFGIGSESYVVGSHEFYLGYALNKGKILCLDLGHFHPTESVADKISAVMQFSDELLLHLSRGVRWDSDHAVILNDEMVDVAREIIRARQSGQVYLATDFFDASINRIGAWVLGVRSVQKALLMALLEPASMLRKYEAAGDNFVRLGLKEEAKTMPLGAIWDYYCLKTGVAVGADWLKQVKDYETKVLDRRV